MYHNLGRIKSSISRYQAPTAAKFQLEVSVSEAAQGVIRPIVWS